MERLSTSLLATFAAVILLAGCNNASLKDKVSDLEQRVAALESGQTASKPAALTRQVNQAESNTNADGSLAKFSFEESTYDFGTITEGEIVEHTFNFTNTGDTPLVIQSASASCGCTVPSYPRAPVSPGEVGEIQVKFNSANKPGIQNKTVSLTANTNPSITRLTIKSNVVAGKEQPAGPVRK
jgi:outer membrane murein-binding lipoprotein Lpp